MNGIELCVVLAPIAGLMAGVSAAKGHSAMVMLVSAVGGAVIGATASFVPVSLAKILLLRVRNPQTPPKRGVLESATGASLVLMALASPVVGSWAAWEVVSLVLNGM